MNLSAENASEPRRRPGESSPVLVQLVTFACIGVAAALSFVWLSSTLVDRLPGLPAWLVSAVTYGLFILPVYALHRTFSFRSGVAHRHALPRYVATQASALLLAALFSFVAYRLIGIPSPMAALLVVGLTSAVNFVVLRAWAFARAESRGE